MKPRISMLTLGVQDLQKAIQFYRDGMGLPQKESPEGVAFFDLNGTWLGLFTAKQTDEAPSHSIALLHAAATVEEVDEVMEQAEDAGANIVRHAEKSEWGGYSGYFQDLDGYLWEVAFNPFIWIGPEAE